jgi:hypothetical protein
VVEIARIDPQKSTPGRVPVEVEAELIDIARSTIGRGLKDLDAAPLR